ncbi:LytR/AlgR family response regulator transcription factor [Paenibacillus koleovorans]|uniref:LytR/AlgR family response regulator transcription factor n=1 Tax=Paenibacillus koleovorans TaxID=121608 RepID=UPI000FDC7DD0|nr:LytTR family DNA-binding domain-containing protein [Paenibacillus koleovorans]
MEPLTNEPLSVVIAEDDIFLKQNMIQFVCGLGHHVPCTVSSGAKLIEACALYKPDLLIVDIGLRKSDGIEACKAILTRGFSPEIILVTASTTPEDLLAGYELNCISYLVKPLDYEKLANAVHTAKTRMIQKRASLLPVTTLAPTHWIQCKWKFKIRQIAEEHILFIKKEEKLLTQVYLTGQEVISTSSTLKEIQAQCSHRIVRTHKSYLVNLQYVKSVFPSITYMGSYDLSLVGSSLIVPLSKRLVSNFHEAQRMVSQGAQKQLE